MKKTILLPILIFVLSGFVFGVDVSQNTERECNPREVTNSANDQGSQHLRVYSNNAGDNFFADFYFDVSGYENFTNAKFLWNHWEGNNPAGSLDIIVEFCEEYVQTPQCSINFSEHENTFVNCTQLRNQSSLNFSTNTYYEEELLTLVQNDVDKKFVITMYADPSNFSATQQGIKVRNSNHSNFPYLNMTADLIPIINLPIDSVIYDGSLINGSFTTVFGALPQLQIMTPRIIDPDSNNFSCSLLRNDSIHVSGTGFTNNSNSLGLLMTIDDYVFYKVQFNCSDGVNFKLSPIYEFGFVAPVFTGFTPDYTEEDLATATISTITKGIITIGIFITIIVIAFIINFIRKSGEFLGFKLFK